MSIIPSRGEIWFVELDPVVGREEAKKRPCLILSDNSFNRSTELAIAVPFTSKKRKIRMHIPVYPPESGLIVPSFIMPEQIRSLSLERFSGNCIGRVSASTLQILEHVLKRIVNFVQSPK